MKPTSIIRFACALACAGVLHVSTASATNDTVLHSFGAPSDGAEPAAGLIAVNGTLYGTTIFRDSVVGFSGAGTVFSIDPTTGSEKVLYAFNGGSDGANPLASLTALNGTLYGTTENGGTVRCGHRGCGTVFSITTSGTKRILHRFDTHIGDGDGRNPSAGLIAVGGTLYGTTSSGGSGYCYYRRGCGTVFSIKP